MGCQHHSLGHRGAQRVATPVCCLLAACALVPGRRRCHAILLLLLLRLRRLLLLLLLLRAASVLPLGASRLARVALLLLPCILRLPW